MRFFILIVIITLVASCAPYKREIIKVDFRLRDKMQIIGRRGVALITDTSRQYYLAKYRGSHYLLIPMKKEFLDGCEYKLDGLQVIDKITIVELVTMGEGHHSSRGFLFSSDNSENFEYIDISILDTMAESIDEIIIDSLGNIKVSVYNLELGRYFISSDSCKTWKQITKQSFH